MKKSLLSNRSPLKLLALFLVIAMMLTVFPAGIMTTAKAVSEPDLSVASIADIHYMPKSSMGNDSVAFLKYINKTDVQHRSLDGLLDSALYALEVMAQDESLNYLLLPGNLTLNGAYSSHEALAARLLQFEADTGVEVIVINGENDVNSGTNAVTFENDIMEATADTSPAEFKALYQDLGYDLAHNTYTPATGTQGMLSYSVKLEGGYRLIAIDGKSITADLMNWIKAEIADAKSNGEVVVGLSHANIVPINSIQETLEKDKVFDNWLETAETLADEGMRFVFTGKSLTCDISSVTSDNGEVLYNITTASLAQFPNTFRQTSFTKTSQDNVSADFNVLDVDYELAVTARDITHPQPYRESFSFTSTYKSTDATDYISKKLNTMIDDLFENITEAGGIIKYIEDYFNISLRAEINNKMLGGIYFGPNTIFNADNVLMFLQDLEGQIQERYIDNPENAHRAIEEAVGKLSAITISTVPSTALLEKYGIGDASTGGTLGDAVLSALVYMTEGTDDFSNDLFMQDVIERFTTGDAVKDILPVLVEVVVDDILKEELLSNIDIRSSYLFYNTMSGITFAPWLGLATNIIIIATGGTPNYLYGVEKVLSLGVVEYGNSIDEIVDYFIDNYITDREYQAIGAMIAGLLEAACIRTDYSLGITYSGPVEIVPTKDDYRLPSMLAVSLGSDPASSYNINWYTKYSVKGTDIELITDTGTAPIFTGVPTTGANIKATSSKVVRSYPALDIGIIGLFPYDFTTVRHVIRLTGLDAGKTYYYRVGDASMDWWSDVGTLTTATNTDEFTFLHMTDSQGQTRAQYETWANTVSKATEMYPDASFMLHSGDFVDNGANVKQWQWMLDTAAQDLASLPIMPTSGNHDAMGDFSLVNTFTLSDIEFQNQDSGIYYSFDYNHAHFAVLNTNDLNDDGSLSDVQLNWLRKDMEESDADWKIVSIHKAVYSNGAHIADHDVVGLREQLTVLMPELDIDLVLQGHDHVYMRTEAIRNNNAYPTLSEIVTSRDGTVYTSVMDPLGTIYVISGAAGEKSYTPKSQSETAEYIPSPYKSVDTDLPIFSAITIEGDSLYLSAFTVNNNQTKRIDHIAITNTRTELLMGDINLDDAVTSIDARMALRHSAGLEKIVKPIPLFAADVNGDGKILASDARDILRHSAQLAKLDPETFLVLTKQLQQ